MDKYIYDAQKLVLRRRHIDKIRFAFAALLIEKLMYRLIFRRFSQIGADDLVQCFSQMRRTAFRHSSALYLVLAGLGNSWINTSKCHNRTAARKAAHITNLGHKLCGCRFANAVHGPHGIVLRQLLCKM